MGETYCYILSTVDFVKELAKTCGWDGEKTNKNRKFLSDLKDLLTEWNDIPLKKIISKIEEIQNFAFNNDFDFDRFCIFVDCREPDEIEKLKDELTQEELEVQTLIVRNSKVEDSIIPSNHADADVLNYVYDWHIWNDGDLEELKLSAEEIINHYNLYKKKA